MSDLPDSIFVHSTVIEAFCRSYQPTHEDPEIALHSLKDEGVRLEISQQAIRPILRRTEQREKIIRVLFLRSKRYIVEGRSGDEFLANVLNHTSLSEELETVTGNIPSEDITLFRKLVREKGLDDFCEWTHIIRRQWKNYDEEIDRLFEIFENNRRNWQLKASLGSILGDDIEGRSMYDAAYWARNSSNEYCLIQKSGEAYSSSDKLLDTIQDILYGTTLKFKTSEEVRNAV